MNLFYLFKDFFFQKKILYVQNQQDFEVSLERLKSTNVLAVDTEFIWRNTYFPKLSLIQISTENIIYIFDCMLLDVSKLRCIFENKNIKKIFHSVRGDASVIYNCLGSKIVNVHDTQIAEDLLNNNPDKQISYKNLVRRYFLKDLPKSETNSNWEKRPLKIAQLNYAAEDVRFLHSITKIQIKNLLKSKKFEFFQSCCEKEKNFGQEDFSESRLRRLKKKNKKISDTEIKIFNWREQEAQNLNVPPSHIFEDRDLNKLKKILEKENYNECRWIIKKETSRKSFINYF